MRGVALRIGLALAVLTLFAAVLPLPPLPRFYLLREDGPVIAGLICLLLATARAHPARSHWVVPDLHLDRRTVALIAILLSGLLWAGTYLLFDNYPFTRDEHMVVFDMAVFHSGHLAQQLPAEWRHYAQALTPAFLLPLPGNEAWVSSYMPVNAMLHFAFAEVADPALLDPLLAAAGAVALFDIAERLFPGSRSTPTIALLLYGTSAQVLVAAMTPYAMTGHLALNLVWLALFLRGSRSSHAGAICVGFLAIGLHQVVFHPLFAAPFVDQLRRRGEWRTAATYAAAYAIFGLFWVTYPHLVALSAGLHVSSGPGSGGGGFITSRVIPLLVHQNGATLPLMAANLVRFVTWQNLALIPLMTLGFGAVRRNEGIARPLGYGIILTIVAMTVLLPYQGHGWGYRYLHGLIGNCALLGAYGWSDSSEQDEVRRMFALGTAATLFASLPFLFWQAHVFVHPYARLNQAIERSNSRIVIVNTEGTGFVVDEVRNRPDLSNRPIRIASAMLGPDDVRLFCRSGPIAFVGVRQMQAIGIMPAGSSDSRHFGDLISAAKSCPRT